MATKTFTQFRVDNTVTVLPTTLPYGAEVYYKDANGNLTLWVGHSDGSAWPVCGYKEYVALISQAGTSGDPVVATVLSNTWGQITWTRGDVGAYTGASTPQIPQNKTIFPSGTINYLNIPPIDGESIIIELSASPFTGGNNNFLISRFTDASPSDGLAGFNFVFRIYP